MAPPCGLIRGSSSCKAEERVQARDLGCKGFVELDVVHLLQVSPDRCSAFLEASTGPMPMMRGSTPTTALETIRARGPETPLLNTGFIGQQQGTGAVV